MNKNNKYDIAKDIVDIVIYIIVFWIIVIKVIEGR